MKYRWCPRCKTMRLRTNWHKEKYKLCGNCHVRLMKESEVRWRRRGDERREARWKQMDEDYQKLTGDDPT